MCLNAYTACCGLPSAAAVRPRLGFIAVSSGPWSSATTIGGEGVRGIAVVVLGCRKSFFRTVAGKHRFAGGDAEQGLTDHFCRNGGADDQGSAQDQVGGNGTSGSSIGIHCQGGVQDLGHGTELEVDRGRDSVGCTGKAQFRDGEVGDCCGGKGNKGAGIVDEFGFETAALTAAGHRTFQDDAKTDRPGADGACQEEGLCRETEIHAAVSLDLVDQSGSGGNVLAVFAGDGIHGDAVYGHLRRSQLAIKKELFRNDIGVIYHEGGGKVHAAVVAAATAAAGIVGSQRSCIGFRRGGKRQKQRAAFGLVIGIDLIHIDQVGFGVGEGQTIGIDVGSAAGTQVKVRIHIRHLTG